MFFRSPYLASLLVFPVAISSYRIDASCVGKGIDGALREGMTNAGAMVHAALRRLNQSPYEKDTQDLIANLFMPKDGQDPKDRNAMSKVKRIFENIQANYLTETTGPLPNTDIMIYCDGSRYVHQGKRDKFLRKIYYDTTTNTQVLYKEQSCHEDVLDFVSLAVTYNAQYETKEWDEEEQKWEYNYDDRPTQIQICPWFIDFIKDKKYKLGNEVARSNIGRFVVNRAEGNYGLKQIDAFSLLDKVLLHEMTHGKSAFEGSLKQYDGPPIPNKPKWKTYKGTDDVEVPGLLNIPLFHWIGSRPAYGWKWAKELAQKGPDVKGLFPWNPKAADHNADSIALFGSAAKLLDTPGKPMRVLEDGRVVPIKG